MNKGMLRTIIVLCALWTLGGCASAPSGNAILSAADASSMIKVTITPSNADSLVAAVNPEEG